MTILKIYFQNLHLLNCERGKWLRNNNWIPDYIYPTNTSLITKSTKPIIITDIVDANGLHTNGNLTSTSEILLDK